MDFRLEVQALACERGFNMLFSGLDFTVKSGTAMQITGANGTGKTSLLRILCGLSLAEQGQVSFNGREIRKFATEYRSCLSYLGHKTGLKPDLTPLENIAALAALSAGQLQFRQSDVQAVLSQFDIGRKQNRPCRFLSAGQKQRIGLARVISSGAALWILDEPATALDPQGIEALIAAMEAHLQQGGLIVFTSHQKFDLDSAFYESVALTPPND